MGIKDDLKKKSDSVKLGAAQAPHRSLFNALGLTEEELSKPLVGIVSSYNEIVPGHMNLDKIVDAVAVYKIYGGNSIIIDFGTETTFDYIDENGNFLGKACAKIKIYILH